MFDQIKAMGTVAGLLKNKEKLRQVGESFKATLEETSVVGQSGGGAVRVRMSGRMRVQDITIDPAVMAGMQDESSRSQAESLVVDAINDALEQAELVVKREAARAAEDAGLPPMPELARMAETM
ncbi:MAG: YbaB/EbfC family nucleoid-associated protein [Planctomycetota bacterium]|jgi:DNA-binding protein YbaB